MIMICSWGCLSDINLPYSKNMRRIICVLLSVFSLSFVSCDKDEDVSFEETPYYLGYFEGIVNDQDMSIINQSGYGCVIDKGKLLNEEVESTVRITKDDAKIIYHPLKSSFKIQVDSIRFHEGSGTPYIEGKMEGILYNIDNLKDSVVIKDAIFGIH